MCEILSDRFLRRTVVRVDLEDHIWYDKNKTHLATNHELIERILVIAGALGRTPYTHKEAREVLGV